MAEHNLLGEKGEEIAQHLLASIGYNIVATKWKFKKKELDIVAFDEGTLVIVEVKTQTVDYWGNPEEFVTKKKQRFLIAAAEAYIVATNFVGECRFDIISVLVGKNGVETEHIKEAFYP